MFMNVGKQVISWILSNNFAVFLNEIIDYQVYTHTFQVIKDTIAMIYHHSVVKHCLIDLCRGTFAQCSQILVEYAWRNAFKCLID